MSLLGALVLDVDAAEIEVGLDWEFLVDEVPTTLGEFRGHPVVTLEDPLGREETLHPDGAAGVDAGGADAHLGAEPEAIAVGEAGRDIVEDAGGVDGVEEAVGGRLVLGDDDVRVRGAEAVDVVDRLVHIRHQLDDALQVAEFNPEKEAILVTSNDIDNESDHNLEQW